MATERTDDSEYGKILRKNIDRLLAERGMRPPELYEALGMSASNYSQLFKREGDGPKMKTLARVARALDCELAELLR